MLFRLLGNLGIGVLLGLCGGVLVAALTVLANLPRIADLFMRLLRGLLRLSYFVYSAMLTRLQPWVRRSIGLDLLATQPRVILCLLFSLSLGGALLFWRDWSPTIWLFAISAMHGLAVGLAWDNLVQPGGFQLGQQHP
jgi:hypothetical protein